MRAVVLLLAAAGLFFVQNGLRTEAAPPPGGRAALSGAAATILGPLQPLAIQRLWFKLEDDFHRQHYAEVRRGLQILRTLDPVDPLAAAYLARFLVWDVAPREAAQTSRLAILEEALSILEETAAERKRRGQERDLSLDLLAATILSRSEIWTGAMVRSFRTRWKATPFETARDLLRNPAVLHGAGDRARYLLAFATRGLAAERWFSDGDRESAVALLGEARAVLPAEEAGGPLDRLLGGLEALAGALEGGDPAAAATALGSLADALSGASFGSEDLAFAQALLGEAIDLAGKASSREDAESSLSILTAVHSIQRILESILVGEPDRRLRWIDHRPRLRSAIGWVLEKAPQLRDRVPRELLP